MSKSALQITIHTQETKVVAVDSINLPTDTQHLLDPEPHVANAVTELPAIHVTVVTWYVVSRQC